MHIYFLHTLLETLRFPRFPLHNMNNFIKSDPATIQIGKVPR